MATALCSPAYARGPRSRAQVHGVPPAAVAGAAVVVPAGRGRPDSCQDSRQQPCHSQGSTAVGAVGGGPPWREVGSDGAVGGCCRRRWARAGRHRRTIAAVEATAHADAAVVAVAASYAEHIPLPLPHPPPAGEDPQHTAVFPSPRPRWPRCDCTDRSVVAAAVAAAVEAHPGSRGPRGV